ncbi:MAG: DUF664 domain-containing protein [Nocardioidaceae bacterium]
MTCWRAVERLGASSSRQSCTSSAPQGGRFESTDAAPELVWVLFHVLQEYARHAGHLDIVRELADGTTGE